MPHTLLGSENRYINTIDMFLTFLELMVYLVRIMEEQIASNNPE